MNNNLAKKNKKAKSRSRFISTLKIISYLIIGLLLFLSNYIMYLYDFKISLNIFDETIISSLEEIDNIIKEELKKALDSSDKDMIILDNKYEIIKSNVDLKFSLNKIKINLNLLIKSSSDQYKNNYHIDLTDQKIIEVDIMSLIDNPHREVLLIFENLKTVFTNILKEALCKLLLHNVSYLGFDIENSLRSIKKIFKCKSVNKTDKSFNDELVLKKYSKPKIYILVKSLTELINCLESKIVKSLEQTISSFYTTKRPFDKIIEDNKDAKKVDDITNELIDYIITAKEEDRDEINNILLGNNYGELKNVLEPIINKYLNYKNKICTKLNNLDLDLDIDSKMNKINNDLNLANTISENDGYLKNYRIIFIVLFSLYGLFILISVLYLIFPRRSIYLMNKDLIFGVFLYYPYLILSFILLIFNLSISSSLIYYNNKNILKESGTNLNEIDKIILKIDKGGYMFISGTVLFLLLKIYLFFRIFY